MKPADNPFKLTASHGLFLLVSPGGSRLWYLKYHFDRKEYSARWIRRPCKRI
ncbi:DUF4102 domain-containing protein [Salmonella enterica]|nr:DUF4102 domain-containing protein [Salmonella enterica]